MDVEVEVEDEAGFVELSGRRADQTAARPPRRPSSVNFSNDFSSPKTRPSIRPEAAPSARPRVRPSRWYCSSRERRESKGSSGGDEWAVGLVLLGLGWGFWGGVVVIFGGLLVGRWTRSGVLLLLLLLFSTTEALTGLESCCCPSVVLVSVSRGVSVVFAGDLHTVFLWREGNRKPKIPDPEVI